MNIIDKVVIVHPIVKSWTGKKKLDPSDIGYNPPKDLVSLGNKRIVPRSTLRPFSSFKKRLERTMLKYGVRLIGGYAVAEDAVDSLTEKLKEFEQEFALIKAEFMQNFGQYVDEQVVNYPDWETSIRTAAAEVSACLEGKFECGYKAYKLIPPESKEKEDDGQGGINDNFIRDDEFVAQAAAEIGALADKAIVRLSGQEQIKQITLNYVKAIRTKLMNLSSLDRAFFGKGVQLVDIVLGEMPPKGVIEGKSRKLLTSLLLFLRDMNGEPQRSDLLAGNLGDPEALMLAMGCAQTPDAPVSGGDSAESAEGEKEEALAVEDEFRWF